MNAKTKSKKQAASIDSALSVLKRLNAESKAFLSGEDAETLASLQILVQRYQTALENITQGICFFNGEKKLILSNRRYAEIYRLDPEDIQPGTTLREIVLRRIAAGTGPAAGIEDYLSESAIINRGAAPATRTVKLADGREIVNWNQTMPDGGWVSTHDDITEHKNRHTSLQTLIDWVPDLLFVKDLNSQFLVANEATAADLNRVEHTKQVTRADLIGKTDFDLYPKDVAQIFRNSEAQIMQSGEGMFDLQEPTIDRFGNKKWISMTKVPLRDDRGEIFGLIGIGRDVTKQKKDENLREGQAHILEMIATNSPLDQILSQIVHLVEDQLSGIKSSILLLDRDGMHLRHGAAPSIPESYCKLVDGIRIGPNVGSCGTAAFTQKPVIVSDTMTDPLWADFRSLAAEHNFRSCWSTPILSHEGEVLGTFAMYSSTVREPEIAETRLIDISTRIAGIAIERKQAEDRIQFLATHDSLTGLPNRALLRTAWRRPLPMQNVTATACLWSL